MFRYFKRIFIFFLALFFLTFAGLILKVNAQDGQNNENLYYRIYLDKPTIARGYTVNAFQKLKLSLAPGILSQDTEVEIVELNEEMPKPWNLDRISKIYQFEFKNKKAYDNHKPFYIQFSYDENSPYYKQVYFYDKNYAAWRPLPTQDYPEEKFVRSLIHLPFARIAVFADDSKLTFGRASWYKYKGGDFAASPDFPAGSRLRVFNLDNGKFVDVVINDYGPDRKQHPDRVIDLDKIAFSKIAPLGAGIVPVKVEPLYITPSSSESAGKVLGVMETIIGHEPVISAPAAIVIDETDNKILYQKKSTSTRPLASLTKLVAIKVFLDTRPSLNKVVAYKYQDEAYNYEWCNKWESARLRVNEGETLTIENLIYSSLVGSANNAVETLVRVSGMSRDDFIAKMNKVVRDWGAKSTHFVEPTGLSPKNISTAYDYAIITKNVLANPIIQKASTMPVYEFWTVNTNKYHRLRNTNYLIRINKYNITGSKTGYLNEAGYCLMTRVKNKDGHQVIVVVMGDSSKQASIDDTEILIKYGLKQLHNP